MENLFLVPLVIGILTLVLSQILKTVRDVKQYKIGQKPVGTIELLNGILDRLMFFVPKKGTRLYNFYVSFLSYSKININLLFKIKFLIFIVSIIMIILIRITNISIYSKEILGKFEYYTDLIYQYNGEIADKNRALEEEIGCLKTALKEISKNELNRSTKEDVQARIKALIKVTQAQTILPLDTIASKVYYRLLDYYRVRENKVLNYFLIAFLITFVPELLIYVYNFFAKADSKREMRFLKKLIIVNGSIKPVDFMEVLTILIEKSHHYKNMLKEIQDANKRNSIDNRAIYKEYIKNSKNLDTKLFYEKLDQANNYDFEQAILNIQNEFKLEKREQIRKVRKRVDIINVLGIMFFMVLIVLMIMYLLIPWMRSYNMSQLM